MSREEAAASNRFERLKFPEHWLRRRAGRLFRQVSEPSNSDLPVLSVSIHHGISDRQLEDEERDRKVNLIADRASYQRVLPGYLAYNMMRAWQGAIGIASVEGAVSPAYVVAKPTADLHSPFYRYLLRAEYFVEKMRQGSKGIADFRLRLYWEQFREIELPVPPVGEQQAIADFLDRETARIDQLIQKKERLADLISARWEALIHEARDEPGAQWVRFKTVTHRVQRAIPSDSDNIYAPLGLFNRGRGFFKKLESDEDSLGDSSFFWVREGDIVFSGQFAWEGAIGLVTGAEDGCVVSHRYPVYRAKDQIEAGYLYAFFRTTHGAFLMDNCSRGAAGRNRPLNTWSLEREQVLVPSIATQGRIARLVILEGKIRQLVGQYVERAVELRSSLITAAVTGQIDVTQKATLITTDSDRRRLRVIVGAEIIQRHQGNLKFGRVKLQKLLYLAEAHAGVGELGGVYLREAAGPLDRELLADTENGMAEEKFYRADPGANGNGAGVAYLPLAKAGKHKSDLARRLGARASELSHVIDLVRDFDTRAVEAITTLYAVWNDALIEGRAVNDDAVIAGVLHDWHPEKVEKFRDSDLQHWLDWMRRNDLVPRGKGPKTVTGRLFP